MMSRRNPRVHAPHTFVRAAVLIVSAILLLACLAPHAMAQVPRTFSYQGVLEENGQPASGTKQIQVSLFDAETGGTKVWSETHTSVSLNRGTFDLMLGSVTPIPQSVSFDKQYYIEVSIDGHVLPRTALASVPAAITASHAEMADGLSPNARGLVTSINELSGGLKIVGDSTTSITTVSQNPPTLSIHSNLPAQGLLSVATSYPELAGTGTPTDPVRLTAQGAT